MKKGYCFYFQEIYLKNLEDEHDELWLRELVENNE
jgi:hypothetical protein